MATSVIAGPMPQVEESERSRKRRRGLIAWLAVVLAIFLCLFACGQLSLLGAAPDTSGMASGSALGADYNAWQVVSFGPLLPQLALEAIRDLGLGDDFQVATSTTCLLGASCPTSTSLAASATPLGGPSATPAGSPSPIPSRTPAATSTSAAPTNTRQPQDTPTQTPTPTPLVYPVKLANPVNIPPGATPVQFTIMVINYGNPTGAELTEVIDRLPPEMSFGGGCSPAGCTSSGNEVRWSGSWMIAQGSFRTFRFTANVAGTFAGQVLTNQVETQGGNFETAVNVRRVYVYTPTPTATPIAIPTAVDDTARTDEDVPVVVDVLANDTNLRDVPMTVSIAVVPGFGSAVVQGDNTIRYTPNADWFGIDTFQYRVTDASVPVGDSDIGLVTVTVDPINDTPLAVADSFVVREDPLLPPVAPNALYVLLNDTGLGDAPLSVTLVVGLGLGPFNGVAAVAGSPGPASGIWITYTPNANYNGPDSLRYRVTDLDGQSSEAAVSINVTPVNDAPVAVADNGYVVTEDTVLDTATLPGPPPPNPSVLTNDFDVEGNPLQATFPSAPANGTITLRANGTFVYTPRANFFGTDSFTYWAFDGALYSAAPATVRITVIDDPDDWPDARDDAYTISEDTATVFPVLANDFSVVDIPVSVTILAGPAHGVAAVQVINGTIIPPDIRIGYTPAANWNSYLGGLPPVPDQITYQVCDADIFECDTAIVTITVNAVHDPPAVFDDAYSMWEDQVATFLLPSVLANDVPGDMPINPASVCIVGRPCPIMGFPVGVAGGQITDIDPATGAIEFQPYDDFNGTASFQYTVADTLLPLPARSAPAIVTITVGPTNDTPFAVPDVAHTVVGLPVNINVLLNDIGIGDIPLLVTVVPPLPNLADGTCAPNGTQVRFTPGASFAGPVVCRYRVTDGDLPVGQWSEADITIYVNLPPIAVNDAPPAILEDATLVIDVLANDSDVDDGLNPATVVIMDAPDHGSILAINPATGEVTYEPDFRYYGTDFFTYRVRDLHVPPAWSNIARVDITITSVNSLPDAQADGAFTQQDTPVTIDVLINDSDPDVPPDPLTITAVVDPGPPGGIDSITVIDDNGTPLDPSDDTLVYTPAAGVWGNEILTYTIDDGAGGTDTATVSVRVNGRPKANDDTDVTLQDTSKDVDVLANDTDPDSPSAGWQILAVTPPSHGTAVINFALKTVTYTPAPFYQGGDSFGYTMSDGEGGTSSATVDLTVTDADDIPVAIDDPGLQVGEGQTINIDVLANDLGLGDEPLAVAVTAGPAFSPPVVCASNGTAVVIGVNPGPASGISIDYTAPDLECAGTVTFDYTVTDADGDSDTATVTLTVTAVNDPPVANPDGGSTNEDTSTLIDVASNDTDAETAVVPSTVAIATCPGGAVCISNGDGTVTYTPALNFFGTASFTYTIRDTDGAASTPGTVTVGVAPVNDPPVAANDSDSTNQGVPVTINAVGNDSDIDGSVVAASALLVSGASNGLVSNNGDGSFTYTPNVGPFLSDSFTYRVWDNDGAASNVATVTIRINKPDLAVIKEASTDSAAPGEVVQFFISIINNGPGTAFSVSVSDDLGDCFHWVGSPSFGSLGNLAQGDARVLVPMAQVDAAPDPQCDDTNRAEVTAANADTSSATVTVSIQTPPTMLFSMLMPVEPTPTATVEPTITAESSLTPTTDPADPTPTVGAEVSQTSTAETPSETPLASVAPPTAEGTATGEPPIEPTAPTDPPTEAPPTPEPFVVPSEEATPAPEPSEPPAPASEPPGPLPEAPMPEPPTEPPVVEEAPALPPGGGEEPPAAPAGGGEEGPAGPPGGGEEPPSESMAAVLSFVRWDRLSRRPVWGRPDGVYAAADSGWLIRYLFAVFAPPGSLPAPPTPTPLPRR